MSGDIILNRINSLLRYVTKINKEARILTTLYDWLLTWLNKYEKDFVKRTTYVNYESYINNYFRKIDMPIGDVSPAILQDFFNPNLESGLSVKTIRNMAAILKRQ